MASISELLIEQGRALADQRRRSGERVGAIVTGLGSIPATIVADRQEARTRALAEHRASRQDQLAQQQLQSGQAELDDRTATIQRRSRLADVLSQPDVIDPTDGTFDLPTAMAHAQEKGYTDIAPDLQEFDQKHDAAVWSQAANKATATAKVAPRPLIERDPTRDLVDPITGAVITPGAPKSKEVTFGTPMKVTVNGKQMTARPGSDDQWYIGGKPVEGDVQLYEKPDAQDVTPLSAAGLDMAALNYKKTGIMPALGNGDKVTRKAIIDRAATLKPEDEARIVAGGTDIAGNKADYGADAASLKKLQSQRDAITAFEKTAIKNIDIFLETAGKVVDSGSPLANRFLREASGKLLGSPDQAAYDAARQVAVNEIAKITSNPNLSGQLSDSARHEVDAFNPREATLAQSVAVMRLLKRDMANRASTADETIREIKDRMSGKATNAETPAPPAPTRIRYDMNGNRIPD